MTIITGSDSVMDVVVKMSKGNPGAAVTLAEILTMAPIIDPENMLGGLGTILFFDSCGIYGTDIYVLWNDQCDRNTRELIMLMRAVQFGYFSERKLQAIAGDQMRSNLLTQEEMDELNGKVMEFLPTFQPRVVEEEE